MAAINSLIGMEEMKFSPAMHRLLFRSCRRPLRRQLFLRLHAPWLLCDPDNGNATPREYIGNSLPHHAGPEAGVAKLFDESRNLVIAGPGT